MANRGKKENRNVEIPAEEMQEELIPEEIPAEPVKEEKKAKKKKTFISTDGILCKSVTPGALYVEGQKSGMTYTFANYGDETEIEYRDLKAMVMTQNVRMFTPNFIVEDEDFVEEVPQLKQFYEKKFTVKDLRKILYLPVEEMLEEIKKLPTGAQDSLRSLASTEVSNGRLVSIRKIKALDNLWGTQLAFFLNEE